MCTVSIISFDGPGGPAIRLACNRDESDNRPAALPPRLHRIGDRRAVFPVDPLSRGTWIAITDAGLALALLNLNPYTSNPRSLEAPSRGTIIPSLAACDDIDELVASALQLRPEMPFAPFRLIATDTRTLVQMIWDSHEFRGDRRPLKYATMFTSSGLGDERVEQPRRELFDVFTATSPWTAKRQDEFHRHQWRDKPEFSVCMRRPGAQTVSYTTVELHSNRARLRYSPHWPDDRQTSSRTLPILQHAMTP